MNSFPIVNENQMKAILHGIANLIKKETLHWLVKLIKVLTIININLDLNPSDIYIKEILIKKKNRISSIQIDHLFFCLQKKKKRCFEPRFGMKHY